MDGPKSPAYNPMKEDAFDDGSVLRIPNVQPQPSVVNDTSQNEINNLYFNFSQNPKQPAPEQRAD